MHRNSTFPSLLLPFVRPVSARGGCRSPGIKLDSGSLGVLQWHGSFPDMDPSLEKVAFALRNMFRLCRMGEMFSVGILRGHGVHSSFAQEGSQLDGCKALMIF